jgi:hypothetical protein
MPDTGHQALADALRAAPPAGLGALDDEHLAELAGLVRSARAAQGRELQESLQAALAHLPRPLRGPVRKVFGL